MGMSLGSPQTATSTVQPPPIPVQAIPDSTTQSKRRPRKRKDKTAIPVMEQISPHPQTFEVSQPGPVVTHPEEMYRQAQGIPHYEAASSTAAQITVHPPDQQFTGVATRQGFTDPAPSIDYTSSNPIMTQKDVLTPEQVFMTNTFGNAFVNPNDAMGTVEGSESKPEDVDYVEMKPKPRRTKAQQKAMPLLQRVLEVDDEFAHLVEPPEIPEEKNTKTLQNNVAKSDPDVGGSSSGVPTSSSAFQNSFLSFLQGKKPETLSSVTNSTMPRPPMPKYVPDPRPVVPFNTNDRDPSTEDPKSGKYPKVDVPSVAFSDDEDNTNSEGNMNETVKKVLSNLSGDESSSSMTGSIPTLVVRRGRGRGKGGVRGRGRGSVGRKRKASWEAGDDDDLLQEADLDEEDSKTKVYIFFNSCSAIYKSLYFSITHLYRLVRETTFHTASTCHPTCNLSPVDRGIISKIW